MRKSFESGPLFRIMARMIGPNWKILSLIFLLCFASFLAGWLTAVFFLPLSLNQKGAEGLQSEHSALEEQRTPEKEVPLLDKMKNNLMLLFDPYKMDFLIKKGTRLESEDGPIKKARVVSLLKNKGLTEEKRPRVKRSFQPYLQKEEKPQAVEAQLTEKDSLSNLKKLQSEYDKINREQFPDAGNSLSPFSREGKFSFLVNVFSSQKETMEFFQDVKDKYPSWSFFIKAHSDHIRVYLGPFASEKKAREFKKSQPYPLPFSQNFLQKTGF